MTKQQRQVLEFHAKFGLPHPYNVTFPGDATKALRKRLMEEELDELMLAIDFDDMVEIADGIADLLYVTLGTAVVYGIDIEKIFDIVHAANMKKEGGGKRPDGKILKPQDWVNPKYEILDELKRQGFVSNEE